MPASADLWKAACALVGMPAVVARIGELVRRELPLEALIVRQVAVSGGVVETVAESWSGGRPAGLADGGGGEALLEAGVDALERWERSGQPLRVCPAQSDPVTSLTGWRQWRGDLIGGLLAGHGEARGILVLLCAPGDFSVAHVELAEALLEPLGVALSSHQRLAELERQRGELEAERGALLERLARRDMAEAILDLLDRYRWPDGHRAGPAPATAAAVSATHGAGAGQPVERSGLAALDVAMAAHIEKALAACHGRVEGESGAARLLGINPHTLRSRMRKLGIDWTRFRG